MSNILYINNKKVDLSEDIALPISYSIGDFKNPENRKRSSSKTITLEGTQNNKSIFSGAYQLSLSDTGDALGFDFNPNTKVSARYIKNGIEYFNGLVRLLNVNYYQGRYTFDIVLFSDFVNIIKQMSDVNVSELDWSKYDHTLSHGDISNSWSTSVKVNGVDTSNYSAGLPDGFGYWYPIIDYAYNNVSLHTIKIENFIPYIYVKETFEKCFEDLGYTVVSDFFNENMIKALTWGFGGGEKEMSPPSDVSNRHVNYDFDGVFSDVSTSANYGFGHSSSFFKKYKLQSFSSSINSDGYTQFDNTTGKITILRSGKYNLNLNFNNLVSYTIISGVANGTALINTRIYKNGRKIGINASGQHITTTPSNYALTTNTALDLKAGDELSVEFEILTDFKDANPFTYQVDLDLSNAFNLDLTSSNSVYSEGDIISLNRFIPDLSCSEFVKGIINMFNLYVSEPNENNEIEVEPLDNFYEGEENWSSLLDHSREMKITPSVNESAKKYHFKFKEDKDFFNVAYRDANGVGYGDYTFESENEYNTSEKTYQLPFAQTVPVEISSGYVLPKIMSIDDNGNVGPYKGSPRIFFNNGLKGATWSMDTSGGLITYSYYPQAHHSYGNIRNNTFDLMFAKPSTVEYTFDKYRTNNLFSKYNRINITEQTSIDGKILKAYFKIDGNSVLDFKTLVNINGVLYRKNTITDYDVNGNSTTKVELYKVLETTELNTSDPTIISTIPSRNTVGVIRSPLGVGGGTPILRGGKNDAIPEQPIILTRFL